MVRVSRRAFLKAAVGGSVAAALAGCQNPRRWVRLEPYVRPPEEQLPGVATWYASTCPAGCGIIVRIMSGRALKIEGNPEHPLNQGKLCARGQASLQRLYHPDRVKEPLRQQERGSRQFQALSWEEALNTLVDRFRDAGSRIAIWEGTATPTHLHHLFQHFTRALAASPPVRHDLYTAFYEIEALHQASRPLGEGVALPAYDLSHADVVLSFAADFLTTWLSPTRYGVEFGRFRSQPFGKRGSFIQIEPRMSPSGAKADEWLPARPGTEPLVAQALVQLIADGGLGPAERVARAQTLAAGIDINQVATTSDLSVAQMEKLARLFVAAERPVAIPGPGAALTEAVQVLNAVAAATAGPGALIAPAEPPLPELTPAPVSSQANIRDLISRMRNGSVDVLLVHGGNPAYDLPPAAGFDEAIANVPFVISFASLIDETAVQADLILPDHTPLEGWGYQVVAPNFGLPIVGSLQPVVPTLLNTRATGDVLLALAARLPAAATALPWTDEVAYIKEVIGRLPPGAAGGSGPDVLWARFLQYGGWWPAAPAAPSAIPLALVRQPAPRVRAVETQPEYPYFLYLYLSELLGDGSGAALPWLQSAPAAMTTIAWQSWVEVHPETAATLGVENGDVVEVRSQFGTVEVPVYVYPAIRPDTVALPLGQGHADLGRYARNRGVNPIALLGPDASVAATAPVKITPTGQHISMATFENALGVREGFINKGFPG